jgi:hypothetical protein
MRRPHRGISLEEGGGSVVRDRHSGREAGGWPWLEIWARAALPRQNSSVGGVGCLPGCPAKSFAKVSGSQKRHCEPREMRAASVERPKAGARH